MSGAISTTGISYPGRSRVRQPAIRCASGWGSPAGTGLVLEADGQKNDQWTYYYGTGKLPSGAETRFKLLQIKFDPKGSLLSYTWSGDIGDPAKETQK